MKNSNRSFKLAHLLVIALLVGLLQDSVFAAMPVSAQAVVPVPGPALTVTVVGMNEGGDQTDSHVSGDWVGYNSLSDVSDNTIVFSLQF